MGLLAVIEYANRVADTGTIRQPQKAQGEANRCSRMAQIGQGGRWKAILALARGSRSVRRGQRGPGGRVGAGCGG